MKTQTYTYIKPFLLVIFIASLALPTHHANAQARDPNQQDFFRGIVFTEYLNGYLELGISTGNVIYTQPETRNDDGFNALISRSFLTLDGRECCLFTDIALGYSRTETSDVDGLTRQDQYFKLGAGYTFNQKPKQTTLFYTLGTGIIAFNHFVRGNAAWDTESDMRSDEQILYEKYGLYVQAEIGMKIQNRHKLYLYYIHPFAQQGSGVKDSSSGVGGLPNHSVAPPPDEIIEGIVGFRYSIMLLRY